MAHKSRHINLKLQNDERVSGRLYLTQGRSPTPVVFYLHGYGSSCSRQVQLAAALSGLGVAFACFDFPPTGQGETLAARIDMAESTMNTLYDIPDIDANRIGLCGSSMGAYIASILMRRSESIEAVALRAPVIYLDDWKMLPLQQLPPAPPSSVLHHSNPEPLRNIADFRGDFVIIVSELDRVADPEVADLCLAYARNAASRAKMVIPGAPHTLVEPGYRNQFVNYVSNWFARSLLGSRR